MRTSSSDLAPWLRRQLAACAYPGYVYGYPHKKAYRPLDQPRPLAEVWAEEDLGCLACYVHVPFCNQRCSFCNLFTYVPDASPAQPYLDALAREMEAYAVALPGARFATLYLGGGTPTYLATEELGWLLGRLRDILGVDPSRMSSCIEASPETIDEATVAALREWGLSRISLGVQSFLAEELRQVNRRFDFALHRRAIDCIGKARFRHFNIDLIYGLPGQTLASWEQSLRRAIDSPATSLFLYPLYVRPLTGLEARRRSLDPCGAPTTYQMAAMYDRAVELLGHAGLHQWTMRQFRRDSLPKRDQGYQCQRHGTLGLGAGARSYTTHLHYSTPWRMVARNIRAVIDDYIARMRRGDTWVSHGFALDDDERQRRFVIQSLLFDGLDLSAYTEAFAVDARAHFAPVWEALLSEDCVRDDGHTICLTPRGTRHADIVGQLFFSDRAIRLMAEYEYDT